MTDKSAMPTDELLMAYADGEASPAEAAAVEAALRAEPAVAERLALFEGTRLAARGAFGAPPVPDALREAVEAMVGRAPARTPPQVADANVVAFRARPRGTAVWRRPAAAALAASVAAVAIGFGAFVAGSRMTPGERAGAGVAQLAHVPLENALAQPSGTAEEVGGRGRVRALSAFRNGAGELCREFEAEREGRLLGVACRREGVWSVDFALVDAPRAEGYVPAGGAEALDSYLESIDAGPPLDPAEEARAIAAAR